ncbi:ESX secretion-associated protein EspG [Solihabitans fulvus]|uniref:ESX secretion-associated protein EspG n=1 Tax=Solihabitans fulvus TaxID=1892852 RepID=UPI0016618C6B|nr:ESX secretion-associated protein EspG [Solihabitans fulvus]
MFECSFTELDVAGDALRLDVRQFPFVIPHRGATHDERIRLIETAHRDLRSRGLVRGADFAPELKQALDLFARGRVAVAMAGSAGRAPQHALAVTDDRAAVLAVGRGAAIRFELIDPLAMVRAVVGLLPPLRPGPGVTVTVTDDAAPAVSRRQADEDFAEATFTSSVRASAGASGAQRQMAEEILRRPRLGGGYFTVTSRSRRGRESEPATMNWVDTDVGRYAVIPSVGRDGRMRVTYTPADQSQLTRLVDSLR